MYKQILINFLVIIFLPNVCFCQTTRIDDTNLQSIIPPSPDATSLGRYGDVPVSNYTGIPNISIPLYTIESKDLKAPISLSYYSNGLKVEEVASCVGLGWNLNAGGVITRTIRGLKDDGQNGYIDGNKDVSSFTTNLAADVAQSPYVPSASTMSKLQNFAENILDGQPDIYYFNFCGYTGKFTILTNVKYFSIN